MTAQGGKDAGYEQVRTFRSDEDYFEVDFELGSEEHATWVPTLLEFVYGYRNV
jgi:hypothetical protein